MSARGSDPVTASRTWPAAANVLRLLLVVPGIWLYTSVTSLTSWMRDAEAAGVPGPDLPALWWGIVLPIVAATIVFVTAGGLAAGRVWAWVVGALLAGGLAVVSLLGMVVAVTTPTSGTLLPGLLNLMGAAIAVVAVIACVALGTQLRRSPSPATLDARSLRPAAIIIAVAIGTVALGLAFNP